ncbi:MAG: hypothetical protein QM537_10125 [Candidatus Symbiobacter sp.]|nr:hypothetical protein [Candidatus Symbiobacter sp.]
MTQNQQYDQNPFAAAGDPDRTSIWDILVARDIAAFLAQDWAAHLADFDPAHFSAMNAHHSADPAAWKLYPLAVYAHDWLAQARHHGQLVADKEQLRRAHFQSSSLTRIEIDGDQAVAWKIFQGGVQDATGATTEMRWQTIYRCSRKDGVWRIAGFIGFLPTE